MFEVQVDTVAEYEFPTMKCAYTPLGELATAAVDRVMFPVGAAFTCDTSVRDSETAARRLFNMGGRGSEIVGCSDLDHRFHLYTLVSLQHRCMSIKRSP